MPRPLKPYVVDSVWCETTRTRLDILFDRDAKNFFAKLGASEVRAKDVEACKALARELAANAVSFVWTQVIVVETVCNRDSMHWHKDDNRQYTGVELEYRRIEVSPDPCSKRDGGRVCRPHPLDVAADNEYEADRRKAYRDVRHHVLYDDKERELPYTDEVWAALGAISETLNSAADKLNALFADAELGAKLLHAGRHTVLELPKYNRRADDGK